MTSAKIDDPLNLGMSYIAAVKKHRRDIKAFAKRFFD